MIIRKAWFSIAAILISQSFSPVAVAMDQDTIIQRLDALEKENSALKERLSRVEHGAAPAKHAVAEHGLPNSIASRNGIKNGSNSNNDPILIRQHFH